MASNTDMQLAKDNKVSVAWLPVKVSTTMVPHARQNDYVGPRCAILGKRRES
jgi:hypothetical protein